MAGEVPIVARQTHHVKAAATWEGMIFDKKPEERNSTQAVSFRNRGMLASRNLLEQQASNPPAATHKTKLLKLSKHARMEDHWLEFTAEEQKFPSGPAWAHGTLLIRSTLPEHGSIESKTRLIHRGEDQATGEKMLITLTTPDTRGLRYEDLAFVIQSGKAVDERGQARRGLAVPAKSRAQATSKSHQKQMSLRGEFDRRRKQLSGRDLDMGIYSSTGPDTSLELLRGGRSRAATISLANLEKLDDDQNEADEKHQWIQEWLDDIKR